MMSQMRTTNFTFFKIATIIGIVTTSCPPKRGQNKVGGTNLRINGNARCGLENMLAENLMKVAFFLV